MFSKDVQTVLTYLALLIILYGAYKALVGVLEGAKGKKGGSRAKRGLDKIKSRKKLSRKFCRKWNKNIKKRKRKIRKTGNSSKKTKLEKRVQGVAKKMCYVGCKQVGKLGLSCGAGGAGAGGAGGAGAGGCSVGYSSKADWDRAVETARAVAADQNGVPTRIIAERDVETARTVAADQNGVPVDERNKLTDSLYTKYNNNNGCMPTILVEVLEFVGKNQCVNGTAVKWTCEEVVKELVNNYYDPSPGITVSANVAEFTVSFIKYRYKEKHGMTLSQDAEAELRELFWPDGNQKYHHSLDQYLSAILSQKYQKWKTKRMTTGTPTTPIKKTPLSFLPLRV